MERQQEIEERSRDLIRKADEKERQELKRFKLRYGIFFFFFQPELADDRFSS